MQYMASWQCFIDGDTPVNGAEKAREMVLDPTRGYWRLVDLDSGDITVVNLQDRKVVGHVYMDTDGDGRDLGAVATDPGHCGPGAES